MDRSRQIARKPTIDPKAKPPAKRRPPKPAAAMAEAAKALGTPRKKAAAAGPKQPRAARKKAEPSALDRVQALIVESLESDKAEEIRCSTWPGAPRSPTG